MTNTNHRREFLVKSATATAAGLLAAGSLVAQEHAGHTKPDAAQEPDKAKADHKGHEPMPADQSVADDEYPRTQPGVGGPVGSATDRGKLVPGLRDPSLPPVLIDAPDLRKLEWNLVDGVKEFRLIAEPVRREILPGLWMDTYGFNGDMPGPTIEINQGDRVRVIVDNQLPEPTSIHWHGLEVPSAMDGVPHLLQDPIEPRKQYVYEFTVHQEGTFFYHTHVGMQEAMGMVGLFIVHPPRAYLPVIDRDFTLIAQEFSLKPNSSVPDTLAMEWNFLTFNGRCAPLITPMLVKLGERVRIRFVNFSVMDHHPLHLHGYTFWITGTEGGRMPETAWYPSNNVLVAVAQVREVEFIANNPGDWILHCHMFHHMMNSMTPQAGPITRQFSNPKQLAVPGYPQGMLGMEMSDMKGMDMTDNQGHEGHDMDMKMDMKMDMDMDMDMDKQDGKQDEMKGMDHEGAQKPYAMDMSSMSRVEGRRETIGMRPGWSMGVEGLSTVLRVLPPETYDEIMGADPHKDMQMDDMKMDGGKQK